MRRLATKDVLTYAKAFVMGGSRKTKQTSLFFKKINLREGFITRLLDCIDFEKLPVTLMNVIGWHIQIWEALLANINANPL